MPPPFGIEGIDGTYGFGAVKVPGRLMITKARCVLVNKLPDVFASKYVFVVKSNVVSVDGETLKNDRVSADLTRTDLV